MSQTKRFMLAMGAAAVGTLAFVAAEPQFGFLPESTAKFVGIAFFLVSGLFWAAFGVGASKRP